MFGFHIFGKKKTSSEYKVPKGAVKGAYKKIGKNIV